MTTDVGRLIEEKIERLPDRFWGMRNGTTGIIDNSGEFRCGDQQPHQQQHTVYTSYNNFGSQAAVHQRHALKVKIKMTSELQSIPDTPIREGTRNKEGG